MQLKRPVCLYCRCQQSWKAHLGSAKAGNVNTPAIVEVQHGGTGHNAVCIVRSTKPASCPGQHMHHAASKPQPKWIDTLSDAVNINAR